MVWADNKFVTMLATTYHSSEVEHVRRWTESAGDRLPYPCLRYLKLYAERMNKVDLLNKDIATMRIGMGKCRLRWQVISPDFHLISRNLLTSPLAPPSALALLQLAHPCHWCARHPGGVARTLPARGA